MAFIFLSVTPYFIPFFLAPIQTKLPCPQLLKNISFFFLNEKIDEKLACAIYPAIIKNLCVVCTTTFINTTVGRARNAIKRGNMSTSTQ